MRDQNLARKYRQQIVLTVMLSFGIPLVGLGIIELYRASHLWNIADIPEPFTGESVKPDETVVDSKAAEWLLTAEELLPAEPKLSSEKLALSYAGSWGDVCEEHQQWLADSDASIELWRQAMEQPLQMSQSINTDTESPSTESVRQFVRLAQLRSKKSQAEEGIDSSWIWLRAIHRYSRYLAIHDVVYNYGRAQWAHILFVEDAIRWSQAPELAETDLSEALAEVRDAYQYTPKMITHLEQSYRSEQEALSNWEAYRAYKFYDFPNPLKVYLTNEPERTRRLLKHQAHNLAAFVDQPIDQQPDFIEGNIPYFDTEFPAETAVLAPAVFEAASKSKLAQFGLISYRWFRPFQEQARQRILETVLALEIYRRVHHEYPASDAELVRSGLLKSVPRDPWSRTKRALYYERDPTDAQRAKVWSVGRNGQTKEGLWNIFHLKALRTADMRLGVRRTTEKRLAAQRPYKSEVLSYAGTTRHYDLFGSTESVCCWPNPAECDSPKSVRVADVRSGNHRLQR